MKRAAAARSRRRNAPVSIVMGLRARLDREGLAALLRSMPGLRVVAQATSPEEVAPLCARRRPTVAILDAVDPGAALPSRIGEVMDASPRTRILAIPPHDAPWCAVLNPPARAAGLDGFAQTGFDCLRLAMQQGAHGVMRRTCSARELRQAIRTLARGGHWVGSDVTLRAPPDSPLSASERRVAWLVGQGRSNKEIAAALGISDLTVKKHISHILRKLRLQDRLQLGLCVARQPSLFSRAADAERPSTGREGHCGGVDQRGATRARGTR